MVIYTKFNFIKIIECLFIYCLAVVAGLFCLEFLVRQIKPQITFSEAYGEKEGFFRPSNNWAFTLKPGKSYFWGNINSLGYRGNEFSIVKKDDIYRIVVLGDSFVFGTGVNHDRETYPAILEKLLNKNGQKKFEVINAGFHDGYSLDSYYVYLLNEGLSLKPDMVILGIYLQNDLGDLKGDRWEKIDKDQMPQKVISDWRKVDYRGRLFDGIPPLRYRFSLLRESHLFILFADWLDRNLPVLRDKNEAKKVKEIQDWYLLMDSNCIYYPYCLEKFKTEYEKYTHLLKGTTDLLSRYNIPFLAVFQPSTVQLGIDPPLPPELSFSLQQKIMNEFKNSTGIKFLDLTPDFLIPGAPNFYEKNSTHWNLMGNEKAAGIIYNTILNIIN